jgi:hypothetical protein
MVAGPLSWPAAGHGRLAWLVSEAGLKAAIVDPVLSGHPVQDIAPRAAVTLRPLVTYLIIFDLTLGFLTAWVLLLICGLLGVLTAVLVMAAALAGVVVAVTSWLRTSIQFTADHLAFTMLLWPRRIPWASVYRVTMQDNYDSDADPEEVTHRRVLIRYRRDPGSPLPPVPDVFGEYRIWARTHFRQMSLPLFFRVPEAQVTSGARPPAAADLDRPGRPPARDHPRGVRGARLSAAD